MSLKGFLSQLKKKLWADQPQGEPPTCQMTPEKPVHAKIVATPEVGLEESENAAIEQQPSEIPSVIALPNSALPFKGYFVSDQGNLIEVARGVSEEEVTKRLKVIASNPVSFGVFTKKAVIGGETFEKLKPTGGNESRLVIEIYESKVVLRQTEGISRGTDSQDDNSPRVPIYNPNLPEGISAKGITRRDCGAKKDPMPEVGPSLSVLTADSIGNIKEPSGLKSAHQVPSKSIIPSTCRADNLKTSPVPHPYAEIELSGYEGAGYCSSNEPSFEFTRNSEISTTSPSIFTQAGETEELTTASSANSSSRPSSSQFGYPDSLKKVPEYAQGNETGFHSVSRQEFGRQLESPYEPDAPTWGTPIELLMLSDETSEFLQDLNVSTIEELIDARDEVYDDPDCDREIKFELHRSLAEWRSHAYEMTRAVFDETDPKSTTGPFWGNIDEYWTTDLSDKSEIPLLDDEKPLYGGPLPSRLGPRSVCCTDCETVLYPFRKLLRGERSPIPISILSDKISVICEEECEYLDRMSCHHPEEIIQTLIEKAGAGWYLDGVHLYPPNVGTLEIELEIAEVPHECDEELFPSDVLPDEELFEILTGKDVAVSQPASAEELLGLLPEIVKTFLMYLASNNNSSYKLVLASIFLNEMDGVGTVPLSKLRNEMWAYYKARNDHGLTIELEFQE